MEAGYLSVGAMGQPMAHKLLDAGHPLTIYDTNETAMRPLLERQARRAASPRDLADRCEIVFVSLPTLAALGNAKDFAQQRRALARTITLRT
jgi:3-hydroxyisobutyrate dehydrogenase-like beta-hydroxyacid dehydrogenase